MKLCHIFNDLILFLIVVTVQMANLQKFQAQKINNIKFPAAQKVRNISGVPDWHLKRWQ